LDIETAGRNTELGITGFTEATELIIRDAKEKLRGIIQRDKTLLLNVKEIKIVNEEQRDIAEKLRGLVKDTFKEVDTTRAADKKPFLDGGKAVDDEYRDHLKALKDADDKLTAALKTYQIQKQKAAEEAQTTLRQQISQDPTGAVQPGQVSVAQPAKTYDNNMGGQTQYKEHYKAIVLDFDALPGDYKKTIIDDDKLQAAVNGDLRLKEIAGVRIDYDPIVASLTKKG
jgi:hypothetical protein